MMGSLFAYVDLEARIPTSHAIRVIPTWPQPRNWLEGSTLRGRVGREEIGGSLMYMLFTHVVKGRLDT